MKSLTRGLVAASAVVLAIAGCAAPEQESGGTGGGGGGGSSDAGAGDAIKVGVNIELSGPAAVQGAAYQSAVRLVAEQINANGGIDGKQLELVIRDNKSDPTEALQVAKGMIENDGVVAMVGGGSSPTTLSLVDYVEEEGVPIVSMGSSGAIVSPPEDRTFIFKTPANTDQIVDVMIEDFAKRGVQTVGFISVDNPYGDAGLAAFQAAADAGDVELVGTEKFQDTDRDYTSIVTKLLGTDPDAIVVWSIPPGAGIVAKNVNAAGYDGELYFDAGAGAELFLRGAGSAAEGVLMIHPAVLVADDVQDAPNTDVMQEFYSSYTEKYGEFSGFASYAADALGMIVAAIEEAGATDRDAVREALEALEYTGITGTYTMSPENHAGLSTDALAVLTVENGEWALAE
jgi:branched-chain amino acid transport system substrate-binding protein